MNIIKETLSDWKADPVVKYGLYTSALTVVIYALLFMYSYFLLKLDILEGLSENIIPNSAYMLGWTSKYFYVEIFYLLVLVNTFIFIRNRKDLTWHSLLLSTLIISETFLVIFFVIFLIAK